MGQATILNALTRAGAPIRFCALPPRTHCTASHEILAAGTLHGLLAEPSDLEDALRDGSVLILKSEGADGTDVVKGLGEAALEAQRIVMNVLELQRRLRDRATHLVLVLGEEKARVIRADRSGVYVSRSFPWLDPSDSALRRVLNVVLRLEPEAFGMLEAFKSPEIRLRELAQRALQAQDLWSCEDDDLVERRLGGKTYVFQRRRSGEFFGRCSIAGPPYCVDDHIIFYVKAQWKSVGGGGIPEGETYDLLRRSQVPCISAIEFAGFSDIKAYERCWQIPRKHPYTIVLQALGSVLGDLLSVRDLASVLRDVVHGESALDMCPSL